MAKKNLTGPGGIRIELDTDQVFLDDPGAGTPAMVYLPFGRGSGTYWCVSDTGEVLNNRDEDVKLTNAQCRWLLEREDDINAFLYPDTSEVL